MYKIIGGDQKEYGPVSADELRRWIVEGRLTGQTLAWAEGISDWKPLASFAEFAEALRAQSAPPPLLDPRFSPEDPSAWSQHLLTRYSEIRIGRCLGRSWRLLMANFGLLFGATALVWLIGTICEFVPFGIGKIGYWIFRGVIYGGLYLIFLRRIRGEPASVGQALSGFKGDFAQLLLAGVVSSILSGIGWAFCVLPGIYLFVAWLFAVPLVADKRLEFWSAMELSRKLVTRVWFEAFGLVLLGFLPYLVVNAVVSIKLFMVAFSVAQQVFSSGALNPGALRQMIALLATTILPLALLTKAVLLLNLPFALGALMYAYEDLFGARPAQAP
jgi:hypothetical protein